MKRENQQHDFMRRQTVAAEDSAKSAKLAAIFAALSSLIALAALIAPAYIK